MKTKQIIKALRADGDPTRYLATEAANRLEMLSAELKKLHGKLDTMKEQRNAAVRDLNLVAHCDTCMYKENESIDPCEACTGDCYVWRGAKDANVPSKEA